jgi:secreted trypsin-like serine protease
VRAVAGLAVALALAAIGNGADPPPAAGAPAAGTAIVGGHKADPRAWGFAVALRERGFGFFCTGSLIAPDRVLTAAHCVRRAKPRRMRVVVGSPWAAGPRARPSIRVRRARIDPGYNPRLDRRDVAVITLRRSSSAPTVALPSAREAAKATRPGRKVLSAGWGARSPWGFRLAKRLKSTRERVYPNRLCQRFYLKSGFDSASMICVLGAVAPRLHSRYALGTTSCTGDSGGPLVARTRAGPRLVGVVSVGPLPCGAAPSIYARVSAELGFIRRAAGLTDAPSAGP